MFYVFCTFYFILKHNNNAKLSPYKYKYSSVNLFFLFAAVEILSTYILILYLKEKYLLCCTTFY